MVDEHVKLDVVNQLRKVQLAIRQQLDAAHEALALLPRSDNARNQAEMYWYNQMRAATGDSDFPYDTSMDVTIKRLQGK